MHKREIRALSGVETRADGGVRKIVGYAAVFDSPTDIGGVFREQIRKGAFSSAIGRDDVRALFNHDDNLVLGRTKAGTLSLSEDTHGLRAEITPPDTAWARDLMVSIERGDVSQMSFAFQATKQEWDDTGDIPVRTIIEAELYDVSPVTYPAYPDTEVALRSRDGARKEAGRRNSAAAQRRIAERKAQTEQRLRGIKPA